tara:strand:+ start:272 stop:733 length:462 start_codon:yes stop_codon:yes gene_type:complete
MLYKQTVILRKIDYVDVVSAFQNLEFVKFLIKWQPVKIVNWDGIYNGDIAHFKFWFFSWHNFEVKHHLYQFNKNQLSFEDKGINLPLGIKSWNHQHIVIKEDDGIIIKDHINFSHHYYLMGLMLYPLLVFPIFVRKILYKKYFRRRKNVYTDY